MARTSTRFTTKPGHSATRTGCLPSASASAHARSTVAGAVAAPAITSTSRMVLAGLKKCRPMRRAGCAVASPSAVTDRPEVLVATSASGRTAASIWPCTMILRSRSSGTASMTASTSRSAAMPSTAVMPSATRAASSSVMRPRATRRAAMSSARSRPACARAMSASASSTVNPAAAATWAISAPMVPPPTMPMVCRSSMRRAYVTSEGKRNVVETG